MWSALRKRVRYDYVHCRFFFFLLVFQPPVYKLNKNITVIIVVTSIVLTYMTFVMNA
jgi:hypothetical protein